MSQQLFSDISFIDKALEELPRLIKQAKKLNDHDSDESEELIQGILNDNVASSSAIRKVLKQQKLKPIVGLALKANDKKDKYQSLIKDEIDETIEDLQNSESLFKGLTGDLLDFGKSFFY